MMDFLRNLFGMDKCTSDATLITLLGVIVSSASIVINIVGKEISKAIKRRRIRKNGIKELSLLINVLKKQEKEYLSFADLLIPDKELNFALSLTANPYIDIWKTLSFSTYLDAYCNIFKGKKRGLFIDALNNIYCCIKFIENTEKENYLKEFSDKCKVFVDKWNEGARIIHKVYFSQLNGTTKKGHKTKTEFGDIIEEWDNIDSEYYSKVINEIFPKLKEMVAQQYAKRTGDLDLAKIKEAMMVCESARQGILEVLLHYNDHFGIIASKYGEVVKIIEYSKNTLKGNSNKKLHAQEATQEETLHYRSNGKKTYS